MSKLLKILFVGNSINDVNLVVDFLENEGYKVEYTWINEETHLRHKLTTENFDVVVSNNEVTGFTALQALKIVNQYKLNLPYIVVTSKEFDANAIELMENGCHDYIVITNIARLRFVLERELKETKIRKAFKEGQEKYKRIFDFAADGILLYEVDEENLRPGNFIEVNDTICKRLAYTKNEFANMNIIDINSGYKREDIRKFLKELIERNYSTLEATQITKHGKEIPTEVRAHYFDLSGKKIVLSTARDITELKKNEENVKKATAEALSANKAKSEFLANMSHEIRTPLNGIIGMTDLTLMSELNDEQIENLNIIRDSANTLLKVINDILDLSRLEADKMVIENVKFNLKGLIQKTIRPHLIMADEKGVNLGFYIRPEVPEYLKGDPTRLQQVLNNLIGNALKFTDSGEVFLSVEKMVGNLNNVILKFSIKDTGIGIAENDKEKLFKSFSQVDGSYARRHGGSGLGLAISKQLVEKMGGEIWMSSELGKGSEFNFTIDVLKMNDQNNEILVKDDVEKVRGSLSILLAEDDPTNQLILKEMLEIYSHKVEIANNGQEVLNILSKKDFDLILMDIQMPVMDGIEATSHIRRNEEETGKHIPIIAVTAYSLKGDREKFLSVGMDGYISKPIFIKELISTIYETISKTKDKLCKDLSMLPENEIIISNEIRENKIYEILKNISDLNRLFDSENLISSKDIIVVERIAHIIKGIAGEIGLKSIKNITFKIELAARKGKHEEVAIHYKELIKLMEEIVG